MKILITKKQIEKYEKDKLLADRYRTILRDTCYFSNLKLLVPIFEWVKGDKE